MDDKIEIEQKKLEINYNRRRKTRILLNCHSTQFPFHIFGISKLTNYYTQEQSNSKVGRRKKQTEQTIEKKFRRGKKI